MISHNEALSYHGGERPGKIGLQLLKPCLTPREMRLAYLPGAIFPTDEIRRELDNSYRYTARGNLIGLFTNGTSVPGMGNVGAAAAKPMMEGLAVLLKQLADIDVFDLELDTADTERFIESIRMLEPSFGAVVLKDIQAPQGLQICDRLTETMSIPVYHENLYSTAVVTIAALMNGLELVEKRIEDTRVVIGGAGTIAIGCARLLTRLGLPTENLLLYDSKGLLHPDRTDLNEYQRPYVNGIAAPALGDGMKGADVFLGASIKGVVDLPMIRSMNRFPIVFAMATPEPEIEYDVAHGSRKDIIVATSLDRNPNTIVDLLSCPHILRGTLDVQASRITEDMLLAAARSLAELAREEIVEEVEQAYGEKRYVFGPDYLIPKPMDPRIFIREAAAVADQAVKDGVAARPVVLEEYEERLAFRRGTGRETIRGLMLRARQKHMRVVFSEGCNETILRAASILIDEGIADPILLGPESEIHAHAEELGLNLGAVTMIDPAHNNRMAHYAEEYFKMRWRHGVMRTAANEHIRSSDRFAAMMVHTGEADVMIAGFSTHYIETLRSIIEVIGPAEGVRKISGHHLVLLHKELVIVADCAVNIDPDAEDLAEIAVQAARMIKILGIEPRVAMLSFSNFGSVYHPLTEKMRKATDIAKSRWHDLDIDGEMQLTIARNGKLRHDYFPLANLQRDANVLITPDLQSGNITMNALHSIGKAKSIGTIILGTRLPAHLLSYGAKVEDVVNLTAVAAVEAAARIGE